MLLTVSFVSCKKKKPEDENQPPVDQFKNGLLVINEGLLQQNNASLSWVDLSDLSVNNQLFEQKTNRQLGDVANDAIRYGNKIYILVSVSSTVEVLDANSGKSLKQISMVYNNTSKQPRYATTSHGKVFISCFDGYVDVLDTTTLSIINRIPVGANPEEIVHNNQYIYVANSGGLSYPNVDSTVSIIDPIIETEIGKIVVGKNPTRLLFDNNNNLFVITQTGLNTINSQLVKVDIQTQTVATIYPQQVMQMTKMNNYFVLNILQGNHSTIQLFDPQSGSIVNSNFIDASLFSTYYGAQFDASKNKLYCFDAMSYVYSGYVREFDTNGNLIRNIKVGLNPSKLIIYE